MNPETQSYSLLENASAPAHELKESPVINIIFPGVRELPNGNGSGGKRRNTQKYNDALIGMFLCAVAFLFYQTSLDQLHQRARVLEGGEVSNEPMARKARPQSPYSEESDESTARESYRLPTKLSAFRDNVEYFDERKTLAESREVSKRENSRAPSADPSVETMYEARGVYNPATETEIQTETPAEFPDTSRRVKREIIIKQSGRDQSYDPEVSENLQRRPEIAETLSRTFPYSSR